MIIRNSMHFYKQAQAQIHIREFCKFYMPSLKTYFECLSSKDGWIDWAEIMKKILNLD